MEDHDVQRNDVRRNVWLLIGLASFVLVLILPTPASLIDVVRNEPKPQSYAVEMFVERGIVGRVDEFLRLYEAGEIRLSERYERELEEILREIKDNNQRIKAISEKLFTDKEFKRELSKNDKWLDVIAEEAAFKAKVIIAITVMAVIFFATGAIPIGAAALIIPLFSYLFRLDGPGASDIAKNFMGDAVFFMLGVLALGYVVTEVGLHRRIAFLILGWARGFKRVIFSMTILFSIIGAFISAHALAAFLTPALVALYYHTVRSSGSNFVHDKVLAKMLLLTLCWSLNVGGPGSPLAGARNAIMIHYFESYNVPMSFLTWLIYGLPLVPFLGIGVGLYVLMVFRPKVRDLTPGIQKMKEDLRREGAMSRDEKIVAGILVVVLVFWIFGEHLGIGFSLGAGSLIAILLPVLLGVVKWDKMLRGIAWDAWFVYVGALGLGAFMEKTGAALWIAKSFVEAISNYVVPTGPALWISMSLLSGLITNFMSDAATTALLGPIAINMGLLSNHPAEPWAIGLATAFATSFAHFLIIGTPNNVITYALGRYPDTGERVLHPIDFVKYGIPLWIISMAVLWIVGFIGVYSLVGFPEGLLEKARGALE